MLEIEFDDYARPMFLVVFTNKVDNEIVEAFKKSNLKHTDYYYMSELIDDQDSYQYDLVFFITDIVSKEEEGALAAILQKYHSAMINTISIHIVNQYSAFLTNYLQFSTTNFLLNPANKETLYGMDITNYLIEIISGFLRPITGIPVVRIDFADVAKFLKQNHSLFYLNCKIDSSIDKTLGLISKKMLILRLVNDCYLELNVHNDFSPEKFKQFIEMLLENLHPEAETMFVLNIIKDEEDEYCNIYYDIEPTLWLFYANFISFMKDITGRFDSIKNVIYKTLNYIFENDEPCVESYQDFISNNFSLSNEEMSNCINFMENHFIRYFKENGSFDKVKLQATKKLLYDIKERVEGYLGEQSR